jgi:hypothetical protein
MVLGVSEFPVSKTGVNIDANEENHAAGFLIKNLKSNFELFLGALERAGTERKKNPSRVNRATILNRDFFCMRASFQGLNAPCGMTEEGKA